MDPAAPVYVYKYDETDDETDDETVEETDDGVFTILARYEVDAEFQVPHSRLLNFDENADAIYGDVGSWYIKHNILHYIDKDGKEVKVEGTTPDTSDFTYPYEVVWDDCDKYGEGDYRELKHMPHY